VKKLALVSITAAVSALLLVPGALAKGASEATITGPGLDSPLELAGEGRAGGEELMAIAEAAGFFPAVFAQTPDPMRDARPDGRLGPRYVVRYEMPGPNNELDELVQHIYPYASPTPVSYTKPGQRFWTTEETRGGWFVGTDALEDTLVAAGLPERPPAARADSGRPAGRIVASVIAAALALLAIAIAFTRRPQTRTVTASRSAS
jgi:hypothetical protein